MTVEHADQLVTLIVEAPEIVLQIFISDISEEAFKWLVTRMAIWVVIFKVVICTLAMRRSICQVKENPTSALLRPGKRNRSI